MSAGAKQTEAARHPISDLTFVRDNPGRCNGRDFWTPVSSGDYAADCQLGSALGEEHLACSRQHEVHGWTTLLGHIVQRMIERGDFSGLHLGFFSTIARAAMGPLLPVPLPYEELSEEGRVRHELTEMWRNGARSASLVEG
jgi:hypothetical protein